MEFVLKKEDINLYVKEIFFKLIKPYMIVFIITFAFSIICFLTGIIRKITHTNFVTIGISDSFLVTIRIGYVYLAYSIAMLLCLIGFFFFTYAHYNKKYIIPMNGDKLICKLTAEESNYILRISGIENIFFSKKDFWNVRFTEHFILVELFDHRRIVLINNDEVCSIIGYSSNKRVKSFKYDKKIFRKRNLVKMLGIFLFVLTIVSYFTGIIVYEIMYEKSYNSIGQGFLKCSYVFYIFMIIPIVSLIFSIVLSKKRCHYMMNIIASAIVIIWLSFFGRLGILSNVYNNDYCQRIYSDLETMGVFVPIDAEIVSSDANKYSGDVYLVNSNFESTFLNQTYQKNEWRDYLIDDYLLLTANDNLHSFKKCQRFLVYSFDQKQYNPSYIKNDCVVILGYRIDKKVLYYYRYEL